MKTQNLIILTIVVILLVAVFLVEITFPINLNKERSKSSASPIATATLITVNQVLYEHNSLQELAGFNITIEQDGNKTLHFPCYINMISSMPDHYGISSFPAYQALKNYGTYSFNPFPSSLPYPLQGGNVSYYAIVQDSNGIKIKSNTVSVEYVNSYPP